MAQTTRVDPAELANWCRTHLGSEPDVELFRTGYLSTVIGVLTADLRRVVIKIRGPADRLTACFEVQRQLFKAGFACPEPLVAPTPLGKFTATVEGLVAGGDPMPASGRRARPFAHALAQLIGSAPDPAQLPSLAPPPPWTAWDHHEGQLWPRPDDSNIDLNAVEGPQWLDEAGQAARNRLQRAPSRAVIGHGDWYAGNLRWVGDRLLVAHDWDSVIADGESVIVGMAAAVFPVHHRGEEPTVDESRQFLDAYAEASGRPLGREEIEQAWAAGVWIRGFDSKKQFAETGTISSLNEREASERLRRAAAL